MLYTKYKQILSLNHDTDTYNTEFQQKLIYIYIYYIVILQL